ncbi:UNVERIFIED_CONTAM: hypothetical protein RMT77_010964 [Armadillidium vulgare]
MLRYAVSALLFISIINSVTSKGNIGCLFSKLLCNQEEHEWCFNDFAFGKCLPFYGNAREEDMERYNFGPEELHTLEREMQRLFLLGYRWSHTYTQCVLQSVLKSIRNKSVFDISECNEELDQDLEGALKAIEVEEMEHIDPRNLAIVRFTPSVANPHSDYADEFYYPPVEEMLPPYRGKGKSESSSSGEGEGGEDKEKEDGEKEDKFEGQDREEQKDEEQEQEAPRNEANTNNMLPPPPMTTHRDEVPDRPVVHQNLEKVVKPTINRLPPEIVQGFPYLEIDEEEEVFPEEEEEEEEEVTLTPEEMAQQRLALPPPAFPISMYFDEDDKFSPLEVSEKDYDYDLTFHSPYSTPPRFPHMYKKKRSESEPSSDKGMEELEESIFSKSYKPRSLRELARMLDGLRASKGKRDLYFWRPLERGIGSSPRIDYSTSSKGNLLYTPPAGESERNFNGRRFLNNDIGFFREKPLIPTFRDRGKPDEVSYFTHYEKDYQKPLPFPRLQSQIPELEPPKEVLETQDVSPDTLHPPYIKSDYDRPHHAKQFENSVSRFDKNANPIYEPYDKIPDDRNQYKGPDDRNQYKWMMADESIKDSNYQVQGKDNGGEYKHHYNGQPLPSRLPADAYYGRPPYPSYGFDPYDYSSYPDYYYMGDYLDLGSPNPWNFQRDERLDVKKPGPFFNSENDFAFDYRDGERSADYTPGKNDYISKMKHPLQGEAVLLADLRQGQGLNKDGSKPTGAYQRDQVPDVLLAEEGYVEAASDESRRKNYQGFPVAAHQIASKNTGTENENHENSKEPDTYVYISISGKFQSAKEAEQLIHLIIRMSGLEMHHIQNLSVEKNQVMFQLRENSKGITAAHLAERTEELRDSIKEKTGMEITQAGVGTKSAISAVVYSSGDRQMLAIAAIVCGVCAALLVAATTLFFLRRHSRSKAKLQGIAAHDTEASKDYQDLCRARMSGKGEGKDSLASGPGHAHPVGTGQAPGHRISSLSKETENDNNSPSSRSSTSSWSEEPVMSNMDISTGHMVLSYMEDHLRNKDRLEQEWVALCAYEAEPCASNIALKPENAQKNRYTDITPYDHNRVILNEHTNVSGSNYINASSITDHDPRNPAYIATQGPLASTAADFWQLVWEQGSVVIVMLTRLTENGQALCHRYWPEEGSELYHIYEVHLVSEHIWCDDYLVRSFYLKNVRTGETRTVTQFHFLSWPESGIPASTKALLEFRRKVNKSYRGRSCPIIVHCSDGVGRTGTYCLIDMVLNRMSKGAKEIDIAATLEHIRDQRPNMVRTKSQFEFVLMSVAEEVHAILKALPQ